MRKGGRLREMNNVLAEALPFGEMCRTSLYLILQQIPATPATLTAPAISLPSKAKRIAYLRSLHILIPVQVNFLSSTQYEVHKRTFHKSHPECYRARQDVDYLGSVRPDSNVYICIMCRVPCLSSALLSCQSPKIS
jgi:hypothetical protein